MYYLTYRSQSLKELDHSHVRKQLEKILTSETIPHAFLFTGPKGTGKTSAARIVAKILNAKENLTSVQTLEPKLKDETLIAIAKGTSPDVIEIDAASHRKIDDVRQLISELKFAPLISKYKIYIIDEVHMLTKEAFNALLKMVMDHFAMLPRCLKWQLCSRHFLSKNYKRFWEEDGAQTSFLVL